MHIRHHMYAWWLYSHGEVHETMRVVANVLACVYEVDLAGLVHLSRRLSIDHHVAKLADKKTCKHTLLSHVFASLLLLRGLDLKVPVPS